MARKAFYLSVPVVEMALILYLCCFITPSSDLPIFQLPIPIDKVVHFVMYFALFAGCFFSYVHLVKGRLRPLYLFFICVVPCIVFGGIIEIIQQKYCPGRSGDWYDFLADTLGVMAAIPFGLVYKYIIDKRQHAKKQH